MLAVLFTVTNDFHHLIWTGFRLDRYVVPYHGRLHWVFHSYIFLLGLVNLVVLVRLAVSSPGHRLPVTIMVVGQMIARIGYAIDKLDMNQIGPGESALLTIGVVGLAYAVAFFCFHAIDPVAAARVGALRQMHEGFLVLDLNGRIVDANPMAAAMLGIPEKDLDSKRFTDIAAVDEDNTAPPGTSGTGQSEITLGKAPFFRQYRLNMTALKGRHEDPIGQLILMHDVSEQKQAQVRIVEQQKALAALQERERLAAELHDGIAQTLGYVIIQTQSALKWLRDGNNENARPLQISSKLNRDTAQFSITDDGQGFDTGRFKLGVDGHFGLGFMQQRMAVSVDLAQKSHRRC